MTKPQFPDPSQMTADGWNRFVDGFDVEGFARQMAKAKVGWVIFGLDDAAFAWSCSPNSIFDHYTGYGHGQKGSNRDLIMDVTKALTARGVKLIVYYAGLNAYSKEPKVMAGLKDSIRGFNNEKTPPSAETRKIRLAILKEYTERYKDLVAGWWFDGMEPDTYSQSPNSWGTIDSLVHHANPHAVIAISHGASEFECVKPGLDNFTAGDTWSKQDLTRLTPQTLPATGGILWHGKIYCGNVYHGQGDANQFSDKELIDWIRTCNLQGGVCTMDWPFDPKTGLIKDFGIQQMISIGNAIK